MRGYRRYARADPPDAAKFLKQNALWRATVDLIFHGQVISWKVVMMNIGGAGQKAIGMMNKGTPVLRQAGQTTQKSVQAIKKAENVEDLQQVLENFLRTKKEVIASLEAQEKALREALKAAEKAGNKA